jgi:hypothetical protein
MNALWLPYAIAQILMRNLPDLLHSHFRSLVNEQNEAFQFIIVTYSSGLIDKAEFFVLMPSQHAEGCRTCVLYGFSVKEVDVQRAINCKGSKRAGHKELLISNYS